MISFRVPGRICFFGDHQDYLGLPVIAGTINRFLNLAAKPIPGAYFEIELLDLKEKLQLPVAAPSSFADPTNYFESGLQHLWKKKVQFPQGYAIRIWSDIPINAGLSSSSALVVAWLQFLTQVQNTLPIPSPQDLGHWAYQVEVLAFDQPGGLMDQYTIAQRGLLHIDTEKQRSHRLPIPDWHWIVAESGVEKKTLKVLENARNWQQKALEIVQRESPDFDLKRSTARDYDRFLDRIPKALHNHWYASIHNYDITQKAVAELQSKPSATTIGRLLNAHQAILDSKIQNTPKSLQKMLTAAGEAGALGGKIIGSGGGGCLVALVEKASQGNVIAAFLKAGAKKAYAVSLINTPSDE